MFCGSLATPLECPLQFALRPGREDKTLGCPNNTVPLSVKLAGSKSKEELIQLGVSSVSLRIRSDEGLTLETSAFRISVRWPIYIINSVDKTKFLYTTSPLMQHHSFFRNYPLQYNLGLVPLQKVPEGRAEHLPLALGAPLRICPRGLLLSSGIATKQRRFEIKIYLAIDGLLSQAKSPIYPGQLVLRRQWLCLRSYSCRWCQFCCAEARSWT